MEGEELATKKKDELLTVEEVYNVLEFARAMDSAIMTPMLLNQRMKESNLNPLQATEARITEAMQDPLNSEVDLQSLNQDFEIQSQPYKRLLSYLGSMLSFDLTYECINAKYEDYSSPRYRRDLDIVKQFLYDFDYKYEFMGVVQELLRNEAYFCCTRFDGKKYNLQELPSSPTYTMITGKWDYGLLFSMSLYWFMLPGVDINLYPPFFKKKYNEFWKDSNSTVQYRPSALPEARGKSSYIYWQDVPVDVGWCWKMNPNIIARVPYFSGLFLDLAQQPLIRTLQKNIDMSTASRLIMGQVGVLKDSVGKVKDQFNIMPETLGKFLSLVKSAIGDALKVAAAPLDNIQPINFPAENLVYQSYLKTALATSGINTNLIFTSDVKPNAIESQLSLNVDEQLMYTLYPQFNKFLEYQINKRTKNFKFRFAFEGTEFYNNRSTRFEVQSALCNQGIVLPQKIAAAIGMNPFAFQNQLDEARANKWVDNLTPIVSGFQMGSKDTANGRPKKEESDLTDSGEQTRSDAENVEKGGKI